MFLTSGEDSPSERKKIERNTRAKRERKHTKREREKRTKKEKKALLSLCFCSSVSLSLSCFFFWLCFFWLSFLSLEVFLSQQEACLCSLSPAILMNLREVFRERHFAAQKRARFNARKERERERERERKRRERARARKRTLFTDGSFSPLLFLSAITARN